MALGGRRVSRPELIKTKVRSTPCGEDTHYNVVKDGM